MSRYDDLIANLNNQTIFCSNLGFGEQGAILAKMDKAIYICKDINSAKQMKNQLDALNKENVLINDFSKPFTLSKFSSKESNLDLINAMHKISTSNPIVISTPELLFCLTHNQQKFKDNIINIKTNQEYDIALLEKQLVALGYKKTELISAPGEFSRRGDIIDIFNSIETNPTRLDFFDTQIESISEFDFITHERIKFKNSFSISPNKINFVDTNEIINQLDGYKNVEPIILDIIANLTSNQEIPNEFLYPFCDDIISFAELDIPIVISNNIEIKTIFNNIFNNIINKIKSTFKNEKIVEKFLNLPKNKQKFMNFDDFFINFNKKLIFFDNFDLTKSELYLNDKNKINIDFNTKNFSSYLYNLDQLKHELSNIKNKQIYLCLSTLETMSSIKKIFEETHVAFSLNQNEKGIILTTLKIPYNICFEDEDKFYIGSSNFAHKKETKTQTKTSVQYLPKAGEYVVHATHGIAKCEGIVTINSANVDKEFFKLIYRDGDILYVPIENADMLSLYMADGANVRLNKLGGKEFSTQKQKAIKSIEDISQDLLNLYAKRKSSKGYKYSEDDYLYTEFENSFSYDETSDQLQAIKDIKDDMCSGKVMDRLICGDVGFGKTEVAMRAVFKAVENGKQVAILAPTTILSLQHCVNATKRMKDFGIRVEMLNRFKTNKEQSQILEDLKNGKINVICGTHRLLSNDVKFFDLGLLVLDEEQRFGVKAKEHIKNIKNNVNVLSLSATPIPRTLSMTLMSIRDISIINTPPTNRLPVKTYVLGYNEEIIANAINDEINRDGQVLVVCNNIDRLLTLANNLKSLCNNPKAKFDIAHGQMSEIALENAVKRLYDLKTNVFVSTTLIENGIDLPMANTLIVIDSDHLGLSQMYQLRGRVGRNNQQAFAYFTYSKDKILSEDATSRLQTIAENTELGSGFKIAMRDLQIRGAGELLGKVQHGHMVKIGYDMYTKLLNDTLKKLKGEKIEIERETKIDVAISSKIPYDFVASETERLKIIAKLSNIKTKENAREVLNDLMATYGKLPKEIYQLSNVSLLKSLAEKNKVKHIIINKMKISLTYYNDIDITYLLNKVKYTAFKFENNLEPTIMLSTKDFSVQTALGYMIEFLNK